MAQQQARHVCWRLHNGSASKHTSLKALGTNTASSEGTPGMGASVCMCVCVCAFLIVCSMFTSVILNCCICISPDNTQGFFCFDLFFCTWVFIAYLWAKWNYFRLNQFSIACKISVHLLCNILQLHWSNDACHTCFHHRVKVIVRKLGCYYILVMFWILDRLWPSKDQSRGVLILKQPTILQYLTFCYRYIYIEQFHGRKASQMSPSKCLLYELIM